MMELTHRKWGIYNKSLDKIVNSEDSDEICFMVMMRKRLIRYIELKAKAENNK